ncbi:MAG: excinuclease ABC subunit C, partial [Patiriisocius sp.]
MAEASLKLQVSTLPSTPGVYQYYDKDGTLLYIG